MDLRQCPEISVRVRKARDVHWRLDFMGRNRKRDEAARTCQRTAHACQVERI
jgi:hypothetical protein